MAGGSDIDDGKARGIARAQNLGRERCLLFVACTRARKELLVTWRGEPRLFLRALNTELPYESKEQQ